MTRPRNFTHLIVIVFSLWLSIVWADDDIERLFTQHQSDVWVEGAGTVIRILPDDNDGSRHQRFILRLENAMTLLIVHNIDLAPRINSIEIGDRIKFRGEYVWNDRGGLIHWTHHDPDREIEGGWLIHEERKYE